MRLTVIAVGRARTGPEQALVERYRKRLGDPLAMHEIDDRAESPDSQAKRILAKLPQGARLVALTRDGKALSSGQWARALSRFRDHGTADLVFAIGGADGLPPAVLARADAAWSFGPQTWPHLMARAMLLEQLYRAASIRAGHPYHRGAT